MSAAEPVTVVVPTVGREALLGACLRSIAAASPQPAEVLIVDQSGAGAGEAEARAAGLVARVIVMGRDGVASALNAGLAAAAHDAVLVTHDDCRIAPDWVGVGARLLREHPDELHTGQVLAEPGAGLVPSTIEDPDPAVYYGAPRADVLYPNCMALSARAALTLGGFDVRIAYAEDNDFCFRWMAAGGTVRYTPELRVWHADWRSPAELRGLYRRYWESQGEVIGKHLRARDPRVVPVLRSNVAWAAAGTLRRRAPHVGRRAPAIPDATYAGLTRLPLGILRGLRFTGASAPAEQPLHPAG